MKILSLKKYCKRNKKKGFTLIELIAVIGIIAILATVLLPKVSGYIKEAKKTKVIDQCRKVVMAVESYDLRNECIYDRSKTVSKAKKERGIEKYLKDVSLNNLNIDKTTIGDCYKVLNGKEFNFEENTEILDVSNIEE